MLETLRKKSRKSNIIRVILSVIAVVALLAISKFAIFDVITGPYKTYYRWVSTLQMP